MGSTLEPTYLLHVHVPRYMHRKVIFPIFYHFPLSPSTYLLYTFLHLTLSMDPRPSYLLHISLSSSKHLLRTFLRLTLSPRCLNTTSHSVRTTGLLQDILVSPYHRPLPCRLLDLMRRCLILARPQHLQPKDLSEPRHPAQRPGVNVRSYPGQKILQPPQLLITSRLIISVN